MQPEFLFDFGSPNAYLAHKALPEVEARTGARFVYTPILLGGLFKLTGNQSPVVAFAAVPNKLAYDMLEMRRFIERRRIPFVMNPHFPVNTLALMRGAVAAEMEGVLAPYVEAVFHSMWEAPKKMDDPAIFASVLREAGLDAERIMARSKDEDVKARLLRNTEDAAARGAFGSPTFFVGPEMFFGKDRLQDVAEAILRTRGQPRG
jgi:2-hydroxychromene-2-carboxylate isomerase